MNWRKIALYISLSCAFSWSVALVMAVSDIAITSITGTILLAALYMPGPALAAFCIQKFIYKEGFRQYGWTLEKKATRWILLTPLLFLAFTFLTFGIIALLGNTHLLPQFGQLDFSQEGFNYRLTELARGKIDIENEQVPDIPPAGAFFAMLGQGIVAGSTLSLPFMFGEEFGWRGLMQRETLAMGFLKASLLIGLVWGAWHFPIILMGHNYPHHPYLGILMMCLFTTSVSPIFIYVRARTRSILGPCMLHGMLNSTGAMYALFIANRDELYGFAAGWAGILAGTIITLCIFLLDKKFVAAYPTSGRTDQSPQAMSPNQITNNYETAS